MRRKPRRRKAVPTTEEVLTVDRLSVRGEGMAGTIAVPFALPGETVRAAVTGVRGEIVEVCTPSADREVPACPHFGAPGDACGGCQLQHIGAVGSLAWKKGVVVQALRHRALDGPMPGHRQSPPQSRRRARLGLVRRGDRWHAGFRRHRSHDIVPITACAVLADTVFAAATGVAAKLPGASALGVSAGTFLDLTLTEAMEGVDADLSGLDEGDLSLAAREALAQMARELALARLSIAGVPLFAPGAVRVEFGGVPVALPSGAFLQATQEGEAAMQSIASTAASAARTVADLFCGLGTFAVPLSARADVVAVDMDGPAIAALDSAARRRRLAIRAARRNLADDPLLPEELAAFDAVILDPPRAGAALQSEALARSTVPLVVMVSCNPATFARDAQALAASYDLTSLTLVDQFLFSSHIETVAVFERRDR